MRKFKVWEMEVPEVTQQGNDWQERNGSPVCLTPGSTPSPWHCIVWWDGEMQLQDSMKCTWKRLASPCTVISRIKAMPNNFLYSQWGSKSDRLTLFSKNLMYNSRKEARERIQEDKRINIVKFSYTVLSIPFFTHTHLHFSAHLVYLWTKFPIFSPISLVQTITRLLLDR